MKAMPILRSLSLIVLVISAGLVSFAQTTSFTYQGELTDNSQPANGSYDFEFLLFDAVEGGSQLGDALLRPSVPVTDGRFSVTLDFGTHFTGANRFLEIRVTQSGGALVPTVLSPRQPVMTVPYAMKSISSDTAQSASDAESLGGVFADQYVVTTDARMNDARPPTAGSGDYIQNGNSQQASSNFNISGNGRAASFSANDFNASTEYKIGGNRVLGAFAQNTVTGIEAGSSFVNAGLNSFFGFRAGFLTTDGSENSMFGAYAGSSNTTGVSNSFFGHVAGNSNSIGSFNSFFGAQSGQNNTLGGANSFFGNLSGYSNTEGSRNAFFGSEAGFSNLSGSDNAFFGERAGRANTGGTGNSFFGYRSGSGNTTGSSNSFFGNYSGISNNAGIQNSFFGAFAGAGNSSGSSNSFFGYNSGLNNAEGYDNSFFGAGAGEWTTLVDGIGAHANTFVGRKAGNLNTVGSGNTVVGAFAFAANRSGRDNTAVGTVAGGEGSGSGNVFVGNFAGYYENGSLNTFIGSATGSLSRAGNNNTSLGAESGPDQPTLSYSTAIGAGAKVSSSNTIQLGRADGSDTVVVPGDINVGGTILALTLDVTDHFNIGGNQVLAVVGDHSTFVGLDSGTNVTTGIDNSFFGAGAGSSNDSGYGNSFFGRNAGGSNTSGNDNTYFGYKAGAGGTGMGANNTMFGSSAGTLSSASNNSFFGGKAGQTNISGERNTFVGAYSGDSNMYGNRNTFVGYASGGSNSSGNNNTAVGYAATVDWPDLGYATAIGAGAIVSSSATVQLGRDGFDKVRIGDVGLAGEIALCLNPSKEISVCSSSIRYKNNIKYFPSGAEILRRLRPVTFSWKGSGTMDLGLVAEEVAEIEPLLVTYNSEGSVEGVKYDRIGVVLVNVVKEQQERIERQQSELQQLKKRVSELEKIKDLVCKGNKEAEICK